MADQHGAGKVKLYIGCSLSHSSQDFRDAIEGLKQELREDYEVFDFLGLEKGTVHDVYEWDIKHCVADCDLFVAICDHASLGLGYELGTAIESLDKPVLAVAHRDATVTRLVQGIDSPKFNFDRYDDLSEIAGLIRTKLASLQA